MDLKRLENGYRKARAVLRDTGMMPYSVDIKSDKVYIQGKFDRMVSKNLAETKRWDTLIDQSGYVNFIRGEVEVTMT